MVIYPDDRILVAIMNNKEDWYRIPVKNAPEGTPDFDYISFYHTK